MFAALPVCSRVADLSSPEKPDLVPNLVPKPDLVLKKPESSFKALTHKICISKHKIDVKTR